MILVLSELISVFVDDACALSDWVDDVVYVSYWAIGNEDVVNKFIESVDVDDELE